MNGKCLLTIRRTELQMFWKSTRKHFPKQTVIEKYWFTSTCTVEAKSRINSAIKQLVIFSSLATTV